MKFTDLGLSEPILRAITAESYLVPTPIQAQAIPHVLAGRDLLGCAQTGTGKTAAFALPIAQRLSASQPKPAPEAPAHAPHRAERGHRGSHRDGHRDSHRGGGSGPYRPTRALILSPTRELALQIAENLAIYARHTGLRHCTIFGGVSQGQQVRALQAGVDIVIATPGRLEDLMQQGYVDLRSVEVFVLDEADRMLDMGFIQPIRRIAAAVPKERQTLLFSATMPKEIRHLAHALLRDPVSVEVAPSSTMPVLIEQSVYMLRHMSDKPGLLAHLLKHDAFTRALVFTRTKHGADRVVKRLGHDGIRAEAIHGNKRQNVRQRTLDNFKSGRTPVLVATDIAARGIDVDNVSHVINYELPHEPETYVHRIGRTGRAGSTGIAIAFCDNGERDNLRAIERMVKKPIKVLETPQYDRGEQPAHEPDQRERMERRWDGRRTSPGSAGGRAAAHGFRAAHRDDDRPATHAEPRRTMSSHRTPTATPPTHAARPQVSVRAHAMPKPAPAAHAPRPASKPHAAPHAKPRPQAASGHHATANRGGPKPHRKGRSATGR